MTEPVRTASALLPPLGADRSGPLGPGLLATGALGAHVRSLQEAPEQRPRGQESEKGPGIDGGRVRRWRMASSDAPRSGPGRTFWWVLFGIAVVVAVASVVLIVLPPGSTGLWGTLIGMVCLMVVCIGNLRRLR